MQKIKINIKTKKSLPNYIQGAADEWITLQKIVVLSVFKLGKRVR